MELLFRLIKIHSWWRLKLKYTSRILYTILLLGDTIRKGPWVSYLGVNFFGDTIFVILLFWLLTFVTSQTDSSSNLFALFCAPLIS
jgi:hypothetical protein